MAQELVEKPSLDFTSTLAEFTDPVGSSEKEDFPKESYLHRFVEFIVERILYEQNKYMVEDIETAILEDGYSKVIMGDHKIFKKMFW